MNRTDEIAARNAARTQGEWEFDDTEEGGCHGNCYWGLLVDRRPLDIHVLFLHRPLFSNYGPDYGEQERVARDNAAFIAHAPADMDYLLAENRRLESDLAADRDAFAEYKEATDAENRRLRDALRPFAEAWVEGEYKNVFCDTLVCEHDFEAAHDALKGD